MVKPAVDSSREEQNERRGIECRVCGCRHFVVVYTRPLSGGRIMRRRECRHCGTRTTTFEQEIGK